MLDVLVLSLYARKTDLADLLGVEARQLVVVELCHERLRGLRAIEIDEAITKIAAIAEIDREVEEIVLAAVA